MELLVEQTRALARKWKTKQIHDDASFDKFKQKLQDIWFRQPVLTDPAEVEKANKLTEDELYEILMEGGNDVEG